MINVLLVDDHTMVRKGLKTILNNHHMIQVIADAENGQEAIQLTHQLHPDVILMDLSMPNGISGFSAIADIKKQYPNQKIIILTMHDQVSYIQKAIQFKVNGFILKNGHKEQLIESIQAVFNGHYYYRTSLSDATIAAWLNDNEPLDSMILTPREQDITRLIALGYSNKEISSLLYISVKTVENHKTNIMHKLNIQNKHELVQYALKNNLLDLIM